MDKHIILGDKNIFNFSKPFLIAEIGANHNGDIKLAKLIIDEAIKSGADAVKFQSWTSKTLISESMYAENENIDNPPEEDLNSLKKMVTKYQLSEDDHVELSSYCKDRGIIFFSTPFSKREVDLLEKIDVPFYKIASMDINNYELLKYVASKNKPVIISTGMASLSEIEIAVRVIENEGNEKIIILHCVSLYPPKDEEMNLKNILMLQNNFKFPIGLSDHSLGNVIPIAATALGACVIEKHFTIDKELVGWDHSISSNPEEFKELEIAISRVKNALGTYERNIGDNEKMKKLSFRRSIVSSKKLKKGHILSAEDVDFKRPGDGIQIEELRYIIGRTLKNDIDYDQLLKFDDFL